MKPETKFPLLVFAFCVIWKFSLLYSGLADTAVGRFAILPVWIFLFWGILKAMEQRRKLDYASGAVFLPLFKSGASVAVLFTVLYSLFIYVYLRFIDTGFMGRMVQARVEQAILKGESQEAVNAWVETTKHFPFVSMWVLFTFLGVLMMGILFSFAISRMMVKKYPLPQSI